jgi:quercetin dioxygenase-like cupin family protein
MTKLTVLVGLAAALVLAIGPTGAFSQNYDIKPLAEKRLSHLPAGPLFWHVETFASLKQAQDAAGPTSLAAEVAARDWLITLGPSGAWPAGGDKVAEIGPVADVHAPDYLLRLNVAGGPPGAKTPIHSHPGSETFYVLDGELGQKTPMGEMRVGTGHALTGHAANMPMQVFNAGSTDLTVLVMFLVDAAKPFSSPASF